MLMVFRLVKCSSRYIKNIRVGCFFDGTILILVTWMIIAPPFESYTYNRYGERGCPLWDTVEM